MITKYCPKCKKGKLIILKTELQELGAGNILFRECGCSLCDYTEHTMELV